jgi:putative lipoprotein
MRIAVLVAAVALAACTTPCPAPNAAPTTASFTCDDGSRMSVTFSHNPERALVEQEGYVALNLPARIVGSGFRFSDGTAELRGHGSDAGWSRPGAAQTTCHEAQTPGGGPITPLASLETGDASPKICAFSGR